MIGYEDNFKSKKDCSNIEIELHGSNFDSYGYDYGKAALKYDDKKDEYEVVIPKVKKKAGKKK